MAVEFFALVISSVFVLSVFFFMVGFSLIMMFDLDVFYKGSNFVLIVSSLFWPIYLPYVFLKSPFIKLYLYLNRLIKISKNRKSLNKYRSKLKLGIPREDLR